MPMSWVVSYTKFGTAHVYKVRPPTASSLTRAKKAEYVYSKEEFELYKKRVAAQDEKAARRAAYEVKEQATKERLGGDFPQTDEELAKAFEVLRDSPELDKLRLNEWEFTFICDAPSVYAEWGSFTVKQRAALQKLLAKIL